MTQKVKIVNETIKHKRKNEGIQEEKKNITDLVCWPQSPALG